LRPWQVDRLGLRDDDGVPRVDGDRFQQTEPLKVCAVDAAIDPVDTLLKHRKL